MILMLGLGVLVFLPLAIGAIVLVSVLPMLGCDCIDIDRLVKFAFMFGEAGTFCFFAGAFLALPSRVV